MGVGEAEKPPTPPLSNPPPPVDPVSCHVYILLFLYLAAHCNAVNLQPNPFNSIPTHGNYMKRLLLLIVVKVQCVAALEYMLFLSAILSIVTHCDSSVLTL